MNQSLFYHLCSCHVGLKVVDENLNYSLHLTFIFVCFNELYLLSETSVLFIQAVNFVFCCSE